MSVVTIGEPDYHRLMVIPAPTAQSAALRDHGFHRVRVARVVRETLDASSFVLDVPADLQHSFAYQPGQFCTFRIWIDATPHLRCYSMSSAPGVDPETQVTVKRVPGGLVSNWMLDHLREDDHVEATLPAGVFRLTDRVEELVAFAGGSGITPILSIIKAALATTDRPVRLLYANRDMDSTIFRAALDALVEAHPEQLTVEHHHDAESGYLDAQAVGRFAGGASDADFYICGPGPFMDLVETTLLGDGTVPQRLHIERFIPAQPICDEPAPALATVAGATVITIELDGRTERTEHRSGTTVLQTARSMGMSPPFSCESGSCATCMARVLEGAVKMHCNNALTDDEVAQGWALTCQAVPTSATLHVRYGFEED